MTRPRGRTRGGRTVPRILLFALLSAGCATTAPGLLPSPRPPGVPLSRVEWLSDGRALLSTCVDSFYLDDWPRLEAGVSQFERSVALLEQVPGATAADRAAATRLRAGAADALTAARAKRVEDTAKALSALGLEVRRLGVEVTPPAGSGTAGPSPRSPAPPGA